MTADDIPGENIVSLIKDDQPVLVPSAARSATTPSRWRSSPPPDRETLRAAEARVTLRTEPLPPVFDPLESDHEFAHYEIARGDIEARLRRGRAGHRGRRTGSATRSSCTSRTTR